MSRSTPRPKRPHPSSRSDRPARRGPPVIELHLGPAEAAPGWADAAAWSVIAIAGLVLAWIAFRLHVVGDYYTESDFYGAYADGARLIQAGRPDPSRYGVVGPGFDAAVALIGLVVRDLFTAAKLVATASAVATLVLWRAILRRRVGAVAALWGTALLAVNPLFVRYGYSSTTDMLAVVLQAASLHALLASDGRLAPLRAGVFAALATLTRYNAIYLVPAAFIAYAWLGAGVGPGRRRAIAAWMAGFAVVAAPWVAFSLATGHAPGASLFQRFGSFYTVTGLSRNVQDIYEPYADSVARAYALEHPAALGPVGFALSLLRNVPDHLVRDAHELLGWPVAIACLLGLALVFREGSWTPLLPIWVAGALLFGTLAPIFYSDRYSIPLAPVYIAAAAAAIASPRFALPFRWGRVPLKWLVAAIPIVLTLRANVAYQKRVMLDWPTEVVDAGRALARVAPRGARVLSRKGQIGYYSGLQNVPFPRLGSLAELGAYCRAQRVGYLYYSWYEAALRPEFGYLLDTTATVPGLTRLFTTTNNPGVVYRVGDSIGTEPAWFADPREQRLHFARGLVRILADSSAAPHHLVLAVDAVEHNDAPQVLVHAEAAIRGRPRDPRGWMYRGDALRALDRRPEALQSYAKALELDPANAYAALAIGATQLEMGDSLAAARTWRAALPGATDPRDLVPMLRLFERIGDGEAAAIARARLGGAGGP